MKVKKVVISIVCILISMVSFVSADTQSHKKDVSVIFKEAKKELPDGRSFHVRVFTNSEGLVRISLSIEKRNVSNPENHWGRTDVLYHQQTFIIQPFAPQPWGVCHMLR